MQKTHANVLKVTSMLTLQDEVNELIQTDWRSANYPYLRASFAESAEAITPQFKWWKAGEEDEDNTRIELIDILHFNLSHQMMVSESIEIAIDEVFPSDFDGVVHFDGQQYLVAEMDNVSKLELMGGLAVARRISWPLFWHCCEIYGMDIDRVYEIYVGKNLLNVFRQKHGYKDPNGGYIKIWNGKEDNEYLTEAINEFDINSDTFTSDIMNSLESSYTKIFVA